MRDDLSAEAILDGLTTRLVGQNVVYLAETGSTNDEARRLAQGGAPEGTLVIADHQTAGRGRLGRRWDAPPGGGLLMSLLFRPSLAPHQAQHLTMVCGLALLDAMLLETGIQAGLKWPNDIVIGGRKAGGILTELEVEGGSVQYAVVGIGLNVNLDPGLLPGDLLMLATSLSSVAGRYVERLPLLRAFLLSVEARYQAMQHGRSPHSEWAQKLTTLGNPVSVTSAGLVMEGVAEAVDANGALLVRLADGRVERVSAGDVTLRSEH